MGIALGLVIAAAATWFLVRTSVRVALVVLLAFSFLYPGGVLVPGSSGGYTTVHRLVLAIFVLNIVRKVARREIPRTVLLPSRLTVVLWVWLVLTFVLGVALADVSYGVNAAAFLWVHIAVYSVFFVFTLAAIRAIDDPWWVARLVVVLFVISAGITVFEHFSGVSYGRWAARLIRGSGYLGVRDLGQRGGDVRVKAAFDYALAYAWGATMILPLVVVVAARARNRLLRLTPALVVLSVAWTYARSAYIGVAAAAVFLLIGTGFDRRMVAYVATGAAAAALIALGTGAIGRAFESRQASGSSLVRSERLPRILAGVAEAPFTGKGLASLAASGIETTDSSVLLTYADLGVVGVAGLVILLAAAFVWTISAVRAPPPDNLLGAACASGILLGIGAAASLDAFSVSSLARTFWIVAALGAFVAERARASRAAYSPRSLLRTAWVPAGVTAGVILLVLTPTSAAATLRFTTISARTEVVARRTDQFTGNVLVKTACLIVDARVKAFGYEDRCYDLQLGTGIGEVRFQAPDALALQRTMQVATTVVHRSIPSVRFFTLNIGKRIRPTYARTAPVWGGIVGLAIAVLTPPLRLRRRTRRSNVSRRLGPAPSPT